jgi:hypothetical protein
MVMGLGMLVVLLTPTKFRVHVAAPLGVLAAWIMANGALKEGMTGDGNCANGNSDSDSDSDPDDDSDSDSDGDSDGDSDSDSDGDSGSGSGSGSGTVGQGRGKHSKNGSGSKGGGAKSESCCLQVEECLRARPSASLPVPPDAPDTAPPTGTSSSAAVLVPSTQLA